HVGRAPTGGSGRAAAGAQEPHAECRAQGEPNTEGGETEAGRGHRGGRQVGSVRQVRGPLRVARGSAPRLIESTIQREIRPMRERDRELRRRRKRRGERLRSREAAQVALRKTARPDSSKRRGEAAPDEAPAQAAGKKPARKSTPRKAEGADAEKKPARKPATRKKKDEAPADAPEGEPTGS